MNHSSLSQRALYGAQDHARQAYPNEACGLVIGDLYYPCENTHPEPAKYFRISSKERLELEARFGPIQAVIHSHPDGPYFPTKADMEAQLKEKVPFGIIVTDGERVADPVMWGESLPIAPLVGRRFIHGVFDCYSLIRDTFRLGNEALKAAEVDPNFPFPPITLLDFPRDDNWWEGEDNLYLDNFRKVGFTPVPQDQARAGDVFLTKIRSHKINHGGVLLSGELLLHHLPSRLSRREGAGIWAHCAEMWIRYDA
jgi:proteasome lid subunit RPN8/RPN11